MGGTYDQGLTSQTVPNLNYRDFMNNDSFTGAGNGGAYGNIIGGATNLINQNTVKSHNTTVLNSGSSMLGSKTQSSHS